MSPQIRLSALCMMTNRCRSRRHALFQWPVAQILSIAGIGIPGTGILIDNASAFTLTITARIGLDASQTWTNNSGNLFTVSGATLSLGEDNTLTVNGTGNTLISAVTDGAGGRGSAIIKDGSGTLTITANNSYSGGTTVNGGTLLVNGRGDLGDGNITVNNSGTLGGDSSHPIINRGVFGNGNTHLTVAAGGNLAPGKWRKQHSGFDRTRAHTRSQPPILE